jgi:hypothetical protein
MRRNGNGARTRLSVAARAQVRNAAISLVAQAVFVAVGVAALFAPPSLRPSGEPGVLALVVPWALVGVAVLLAVNSVLERADRHILLSIIRRQRATEKATG